MVLSSIILRFHMSLPPPSLFLTLNQSFSLHPKCPLSPFIAIPLDITSVAYIYPVAFSLAPLLLYKLSSQPQSILSVVAWCQEANKLIMLVTPLLKSFHWPFMFLEINLMLPNIIWDPPVSSYIPCNSPSLFHRTLTPCSLLHYLEW